MLNLSLIKLNNKINALLKQNNTKMHSFSYLKFKFKFGMNTDMFHLPDG